MIGSIVRGKTTTGEVVQRRVIGTDNKPPKHTHGDYLILADQYGKAGGRVYIDLEKETPEVIYDPLQAHSVTDQGLPGLAQS